MTKLRIVIEDRGNGEFSVAYVGLDASQADAVLHADSPYLKALYVKPRPAKYKHPMPVTAAAPAPASPVVAKPETKTKKK